MKGPYKHTCTFPAVQDDGFNNLPRFEVILICAEELF